MRFHPDVMGVDHLAAQIRKIPNFPKDGILFHDITTVLQSPEYFRLLVDLFTYHYMGQKIDIMSDKVGSAWFYYWRGVGVSIECRICADSQKR